MFRRIILGLLGMAFGFWLMYKRQKIVDMGVRFSWAENFMLGSYTVVGLTGVFFMVISLFYMLGIGKGIIDSVFGSFTDMFTPPDKK
ncbi:MAG: hypothetical protein UT66_C0017G0015 [candidate division CPR2 bacterium GW2011_GWC1_39_9]|uniref:Uncharacterized protein n=1 Tax=candidate division CPR2 bacterium GW2011_GWC2_39_10 TaxID=1618345 RepID=A0A0G0LTV1_UNCC2|nr:MAG: hypothetical protein UT18_C0010G0024 [candidate division CPR2 bacterium GW2011_GWC2_39_10]KKR34736.1 MAG: hypothetical protein UT66_C0017G0015 [candidate division CPR2 bacterium GW2011_GWC1_39_9]